MTIDTAFVGALHVEYLKKRDLGKGESPHHTLFQTSTIDALLEGSYDGDVTFAELADRGNFGLGTLDALDGEMIALDGRFYQVRADGRAYPVDGRARTPFAVVTVFEPDVPRTLAGPMDFGALRVPGLGPRRRSRVLRHQGIEATRHARARASSGRLQSVRRFVFVRGRIGAQPQ